MKPVLSQTDTPRLILLVDDDETVLRALTRIMKHRGLSVEATSTATAALDLLTTGLRPDIVFADHKLPGMTGVELLTIMRSSHPTVVRVCMSGCADSADIVAAINAGSVSRYLLKPWTHKDINNALAAVEQEIDKKHAEEVQMHFASAELLTERTRTQTLRLTGVQALAASVEARDPYTAGHGALVGSFGAILGEAIGMGPDDLQRLKVGGVLHDIGKIGLPDAVLFKPGRLTNDEIAVMREHPGIGVRMLSGLSLPHDVVPIVRSHHERWDGDGYPDRTVGRATNQLARVIHVVDVYEALTAKRVYRDPMSTPEIVDFFVKGSGTDFDPSLVEPFLHLLSNGDFDRIRAATKATSAKSPSRFGAATIGNDGAIVMGAHHQRIS